MRTKLALLLALCRGAELLILDEPTSGLDPAMTEEVLQALVAHVAREEMTVFFSSHQIAEVDQIADHVAIIDRGRAVVSGALDDLREQLPPHPAGVRRRRAGAGVPRAGRRARAAQGPRAHGAVERGRRADRRRGARAEPGVGRRRPRHAEGDLSRDRRRRRTDMLWYKSWLETRWRFLIGLALLMLLRRRHRVRAIRGSMQLLPLRAGRSTPAASSAGGSGRRAELCAHLPRLRLVAVVPAEHGAGRGRCSPCCSAPAACSPGVGRARCSRCRCRSRASGCSGSAPRPAWRSCSCSPSSRRSCSRCSRRPSARATASATRSSTRVCLFVAGLGVLQPGVPAVDGVQRRVAAAAHHALAARRAGLFEQVLPASLPSGLFFVMSAESYFRGGGRAVAGPRQPRRVSAALIYGATVNIARRDF